MSDGEQLRLASVEQLHRAQVGTDLFNVKRAAPRLAATVPITSLLAWECGQKWKNNPLTAFRLKSHKSLRPTHRSERQFPYQSLAPCESIVSRIIEIRESMHENLRSEKKGKLYFNDKEENDKTYNNTKRDKYYFNDKNQTWHYSSLIVSTKLE